MRVIAKPGQLCPRIDPRMPPIGDSEAAEVADVAYYRRRIADGSLARVDVPDDNNRPVTPAARKNHAGDDGNRPGKGKA